MKGPNVRACCSWEDFESGLKHIWRLPIPIDWQQAREAWSQHCATPGEFYRHAQQKLASAPSTSRKTLRHRGSVVSAATQEELDRFLINDAKIRAGQCPNDCGPMKLETRGVVVQRCEACDFTTNAMKDGS